MSNFNLTIHHKFNITSNIFYKSCYIQSWVPRHVKHFNNSMSKNLRPGEFWPYSTQYWNIPQPRCAINHKLRMLIRLSEKYKIYICLIKIVMSVRYFKLNSLLNGIVRHISIFQNSLLHFQLHKSPVKVKDLLLNNISKYSL